MSARQQMLVLALSLLAFLGFVAGGVAVGTVAAPVDRGARSDGGGEQVVEMAAARIPVLGAQLTGGKPDGDALKELGLRYRQVGEMRLSVAAYVAAAEMRPNDAEIVRALEELRAMAQRSGKH